ncbi:MAG: hypothetical protein IJ301_00735 [Clostridia bacterium]|nr:hypothetical protein [Clostridia bacterium]
MSIKNFNASNPNENFEEITNSEEFEQVQNQYGDLVEEFVSKYGEMSEAELMSEMLKLVAEKKKDGTFDAEQIKLVAEQVAPLLDDEQRGKMYNLLKFLD